MWNSRLSSISRALLSFLLALPLLCSAVTAASSSSSGCSSTLTPTNGAKPTAASGYQIAVVATGLASPRGIHFDADGNLLVVEQGTGISWLAFKDNGGACLSVADHGSLIADSSLNHGIEISTDGKTLYASSTESVWAWDYNSSSKKLSQNRKTLVTNMQTDDHTTRTLLLSRKENGTLLVSRGSTSNIDLSAATLSSGHSQIRAFNLNNVTDNGYDYNTEGQRIGWGLRNSVGVAEHPVTGGIYSVENSVDQLQRDGTDIHEDNPGEEMNFHGYLNGTSYWAQGLNYGYPYCFAAWVVSDIPQNSNLSVGSQFAIDLPNGTKTDQYCAAQVPPRLTFQAHMAPLDIKFNDSGSEAWVTFHGSWDRTDPVGYKLSRIPFINGEPVAAPDNKTATTDILANQDDSKCPDNCFRPVGIAFDSQGRLFMSSDATGEIYVVVKEASPNATQTGSAPAASSSHSTGVLLSTWPGSVFTVGIISVASYMFFTR